MSPRHGDDNSNRVNPRSSAQKGVRRKGASRRHAWRDEEESRGRRKALRSQDDERHRLWDDEEDEDEIEDDFDVEDEDEDVEDDDAEDSDEESDDWYLSRYLGRNRLEDDYDDDN